MKLLQKILSHGLLIAFFVAVFFLYLYRVDLFPQWFGEDTQRLAKVEPGKLEKQSPVVPDTTAQPARQAEVEQDKISTVQPPVVEQTGIPVVSDQPPAAQQTEAAVSAAVKETGGQASSDVAPQQAPAATTPVTEEQTGVPATAPTDPQFRPLEPARDVASRTDVTPPAQEVVAVVEPVQAPVEGKAAVDPAGAGMAKADVSDFQSKLAEARAIYWRQDIHGAIEAYERLTESYPDRADAWGELGNLYFSMKQQAKAAEAYTRAIQLMIASGDINAARQLIGVMHRLDPGKASELEMQLRQAGG